MTIFAVNTIVHREGQPVAFSVGDELPEWAEDLVGNHCLEAPVEPSDAPDAEDSDGVEPDAAPDAGADDEAPVEPSDAPDFTAPAPRQTRARRK